MRQHICKKCGKIYLTDNPDSWYCPDCADESKHNVMRRKVCATCGVEFMGYPRSKYCQECRIEAQREADRRHKRNGTARPIGSVDICENCGKQYIVNGSRQRYCPDCAKEVVGEKVKQMKRQWAEGLRDTIAEQKAEKRKDRRVCVICGRFISSLKPTVTCSPECAKEYKRRKQAEVDVRRGRAKPARIAGKMEHTNPQSGVPGVTWHKKCRKWQLIMKGKYIGLFDTFDEAKKMKDWLGEEKT